MMRGVLVCTIVSLLAIPVFGGNATLSIQATALDGSPLSVLDGGVNKVDPALLGGAWFLDIVITGDEEQGDDLVSGMSAFAITLNGPAALTYQAMEDFYGLQVNNYAGSPVPVPHSLRPVVPDNNWSNVPADCSLILAGALPMAGPPADEIGTIHEQDLDGTVHFAQNGLAAFLVMDGIAPDFAGAINDGGTAYVGDSLYQPTNLTVVPLSIVPEPVSALLLLIGLPLLRRRR